MKATPRTGLATAYTYDALGNVASVTQGEQVTKYEYDLLGRLTKQIAADGTETTYAYDALGNLVGQTDPLGNETAFSYTAESLLEMVTYANGTTQSLGYDLAGNVVSETDGEGFTKQYQYDKVNRLTAVIDEAGSKTSYKYDALDNIAQVTDALKHATKYTYDLNGNLTSETDALGNKVEYAYTPEGWLSTITKADGTVQTFTYDKTGNLLTQNVGDNQSITSSYNEIGMVTEVSSPEGKIAYQYNEKGYLVSVTNANGDVVSYTYDEYGNKASMTYPDGRTVNYSYDVMNRMTSVTGLDGEVTTYAYDAAGRRVETTTGSGTAASTLKTAYSYDSVGNLLTQATSGASSIAFSYSYNKNGYITGEKRTEDGKTTTSSYAYDPLGEVTSFLQSTGYGETYTYDKAGNMTSKVITSTHAEDEEAGAVTLKMKYNKGNQLTSMANGKDAISYSYDKNGSMVQKVLSSKQYGKLTDTYAYNALDQISSYTGYDGYTQQFTYDANGMRLTKAETGNGERSTLEELLRGNIAGLPEIITPAETQTNDDAATVPAELEWATTEYLYGITQEYYQVIEETTSGKSGSATTAYAYGLERIAAYTESDTTRYVFDGRGSVAQTISAPFAGNAVTAVLPDVKVTVKFLAYTAFGEQMGNIKVSGYAYNAEAFDAATDMINLRARQYEPTLNRFSQKDFLRGNVISGLSLNRYAFVENSPINYLDALGLVKTSVSNAIRSVAKVVGTIGKGVTVSKGTVSSVSSKKSTSSTKKIDKIGTKIKSAATVSSSSRSNASSNAKKPETIGEYAGYYLDGVKAVGTGIWEGNRQRTNEAFSNPGVYSIANWLLFGAIDAITGAYQGAKERTEAMQKDQSAYNASNWLTSGAVGTIKDAITVDPSNPAKQWIASFGVAGMVFTGYTAAGGCSILRPSGLGQPLSPNLSTYGYDKWPTQTIQARYSPANSGPLPENISNTFTGGSYTEAVLTEDTVFYRVYGGDAGEIGRYLTRTPQNGGLQSQIDLALNPQWGNNAEKVVRVIVPKGTVIYEGTAAPQIINDGLGELLGGGNQIYIPEVNEAWFQK